MDKDDLRGTKLAIIVAILIPGLFFVYGVQTKHYGDLSQEIAMLEKKQEVLIEQNKKYISDISMLTSTDRIEEIATNELGMHKALTQEIVRVEIGQ